MSCGVLLLFFVFFFREAKRKTAGPFWGGRPPPPKKKAKRCLPIFGGPGLVLRGLTSGDPDTRRGPGLRGAGGTPKPPCETLFKTDSGIDDFHLLKNLTS